MKKFMLLLMGGLTAVSIQNCGGDATGTGADMIKIYNGIFGSCSSFRKDNDLSYTTATIIYSGTVKKSCKDYGRTDDGENCSETDLEHSKNNCVIGVDYD